MSVEVFGVGRGPLEQSRSSKLRELSPMPKGGVASQDQELLMCGLELMRRRMLCIRAGEIRRGPAPLLCDALLTGAGYRGRLPSAKNLRNPSAAHADASRQFRTGRDLARIDHPTPLSNALVGVRPATCGPSLPRRRAEIHHKHRKQVLT